MRPVGFPSLVPGDKVEGPYNITGNFALTVLGWIATARGNEVNSADDPSTIFDSSTRTSTTCYMRGLKENIELSTSTGTAWQWRRICFTFKSFDIISVAGINQLLFHEDTSGIRRSMHSLTSASPEAVGVFGNLQSLLFKGRLNTDYANFFTAATDPHRVNVRYDQTRMIRSGNERGTLRNVKLWHPMGKNLIYDDDELGGETEEGFLSTRGSGSMGDYYVVDFFRPANIAGVDDVIRFDPTATLYWHEK